MSINPKLEIHVIGEAWLLGVVSAVPALSVAVGLIEKLFR